MAYDDAIVAALKLLQAGPAYAASGQTPVTGSLSAPGQTAGLPLIAGREAYLRLTGGTSAVGIFEFSRDDTIWTPLDAEGTPLGVISYAGSSKLIVAPLVSLAGLKLRANFSAVSGTVAYRLEQ